MLPALHCVQFSLLYTSVTHNSGKIDLIIQLKRIIYSGSSSPFPHLLEFNLKNWNSL